MQECISCDQALTKSQKRYCSNICQREFEYRQYIERWKSDGSMGGRGVHARNISAHVARYMFAKHNNACSRCGWSEINESTGRTPLEIDHIDGDAENNRESNLQLLCPNCHSLTSNYKNLNKGHGRLWRRKKYVKIDKVPL